KQRYHQARVTQLGEPPSRTRLSGISGLLALAATALPVLFGFGIPIRVLAGYAWMRPDQLSDPALRSAFFNSLLTATAASVLAVLVALVLLNAARISRSRLIAMTGRLGSLGYALPGTILGFGLLYALTSIDRTIDLVARNTLGSSTGLLLSGTAAAVVLACTIRFLALADGAIRSGLEKLPPHLDEAARNLGRTPARSAA